MSPTPGTKPAVRTYWRSAAPLTFPLGERTARVQADGLGQPVRQFSEAYGLEKSAISERCVEANREKQESMRQRRLDRLRLWASPMRAAGDGRSGHQ